MRIRSRSLVVAGCLSTLVLPFASPAQAASGSYSGNGDVQLRAAAGETLNVTAWFAAEGLFQERNVLSMATGDRPISFTGCANAPWAQERGDVHCVDTPTRSIAIDAGTSGDYTSVTAYSEDSPMTIRVDASGTTGGGSLTGSSRGSVTLLGGAGSEWIELGDREIAGSQLRSRSGGGNDIVLIANAGPDAVVAADAGAGADDVSFSGRARRVGISLGAGNDEMASSGGARERVTISGGGGDDVIEAMNGPMSINGGAGNDLFEPDQNPQPPGTGGVPADPTPGDVVRGGAGKDALAIGGEGRAGRMTRISLDGRPNDGHKGERDNYHPDLELITVASYIPAVVSGSKGAETISLNGTGRNLGLGGADRLTGGSVIVGGPGRDTVIGSSETRTIRAQDGQRDTIRCSPDGATLVYADRVDVVSRHTCAKVRRK